MSRRLLYLDPKGDSTVAPGSGRKVDQTALGKLPLENTERLPWSDPNPGLSLRLRKAVSGVVWSPRAANPPSTDDKRSEPRSTKEPPKADRYDMHAIVAKLARRGAHVARSEGDDPVSRSEFGSLL